MALASSRQQWTVILFINKVFSRKNWRNACYGRLKKRERFFLFESQTEMSFQHPTGEFREFWRRCTEDVLSGINWECLWKVGDGECKYLTLPEFYLQKNLPENDFSYFSIEHWLSTTAVDTFFLSLYSRFISRSEHYCVCIIYERWFSFCFWLRRPLKLA